MSTRRHVGILKYGKRKSAPSDVKFQAGGAFSTYASGYDWREDPYEMALMRQRIRHEDEDRNFYKQQKLGASTGRGNKRSSVLKPSDYRQFSVLEGGLQSSRDALNKHYEGLQKQYMDMVAVNGVEAVNASEQGNALYNQLIKWGTDAEGRLQDEEDRLKYAIKDMSPEDKEALAISTDLQKFVLDTKDGAKKPITHGEYLKDPDRYDIQTNEEFIQWKTFEDEGMNIAAIDKFLLDGSVGEVTSYDRYIKSKEDQLQYQIINNKVVNTADKGDGKKATLFGDPETFRNLINIAMGGAPDILESTSISGDKAAQKDALYEAARSVYGELLRFNTDKQKFRNSIMSAVLKDRNVKEQLGTLSTIEERDTYLTTQMYMYAMKQLVDKGAMKKTNAKDEGASSGEVYLKGAPGAVLRGYKDLLNSTNKKVYVIGKGIADKEDKKARPDVSTSNTVIIEGVIPAGDLGIYKGKHSSGVELDNSTVARNTELNRLADVKNGVWTHDGYSADQITGGNPEKLLNNAYIDPSSSLSIVLLPTRDGEPIIDDIVKDPFLLDLKTATKQAFIEYRNSLGNPSMVIKTKADMLKPNNTTNSTGIKDYHAYTAWLDKGYKVPYFEDKIKKAKAEGKNTKLLELDLKEAKNAGKILNGIIKSMNKNPRYTQGRVTMEPYFIVHTTITDKSSDMNDNYKKISGREDGFAEASKKQRDELKDLFKVDTGLFEASSEYLQGDLIIKAKGPNLAGDPSASIEKLSAVETLLRELNNNFNLGSIFSNKTEENAANFAKD